MFKIFFFLDYINYLSFIYIQDMLYEKKAKKKSSLIFQLNYKLFSFIILIKFPYIVLPSSENPMDDVEYNERFWWRSTGEMTSAFKQALNQGAPFPIVSLAEYFSLHQEGFSWGSKYRQAGYYASLMLWYVSTKYH